MFTFFLKQIGEKVGQSTEEDAVGDYQETENVEEQEEGGSFEIVPDEGGPEHIMVPDAEVDSTTVEAYTAVLAGDTPKQKRRRIQKKWTHHRWPRM